ncbi:Glycosyltransferase, GT2 family [Amycolatopsis arida]|uniref:Glycosyltransferase, GT2 family n=1 Tax=Amycolatopsis arida TaxID=587909 RepID=A0A1I5PL95_9PSEU|nr:glycosyltransferase [Amycolatopsis arida]TDX98535.1 GT2 family glycosyltransferase [Amycolatopsis arida]SFP34834.1 Glycosyltransferase, GT2 family [Amycolatopsis arida]
MPRTPTPPLRTAPVLAILVCHNGEAWLPLALSALRRGTIRPRHVLAVDTGSTDRTPELLAEAVRGAAVDSITVESTAVEDTVVENAVAEATAIEATAIEDAVVEGTAVEGVAAAREDAGGGRAEPVLSGVLTLPAGTGFGAAVAAAVAHAEERWGDPGTWLWVLHDDCAPEPDCLDILLRAAEAAPSAAVLGPLGVDWADPRLIVSAGLSTDASGHRRHVATGEGERGAAPEQSTEVLAVPSAGALIRRGLWTWLDGFDPALPLLREDLDFGWRANAAGALVLSVPLARVRHARAASRGLRATAALPGSLAAADRAHGLRTFLVNCSTLSFLLGVPRLVVLSVLRGLGFAVLRDATRARAEFAAAGYLLSGRAKLRAARSVRRAAGTGPGGPVRGLFTSRLARLRAAVRRGVVHLVRRGVASEAALGRLPAEVVEGASTAAWIPPEAMAGRGPRARPVGPEALPAGAVRGGGRGGVRGLGLRRPGGVVAVALPDRAARDHPAEREPAGEAVPRPSPGRRVDRELVFVEVDRRRVLAATVFAPPVVLTVVLTALALVVHAGRLGLDLAGGRLLPVGDLGQVWSTYLAAWHPVAGGTAAAAPVTLAVLGVLGAPLAPLGGPAAAVALLLITDAPLAALVAYAATRRLRVRRWVRAGAAAAYGLLPVATAAVAQGRLDVVVVHILLPALVALLAAVLTRADRRWLSTAALCAIVLALVGAFSPQVHALALLGLAGGFVVLPGSGRLPRRIAAIAITVLLPLALLLPWLPAVLAHPALLAHGLSGADPVPPAPAELVGLDPGGPGAQPLGVLLVVAALVALVLRPSRRALPGLGVVALGAAGVVATRLVTIPPAGGGEPVPGDPAVPLLVVAAGLLLVVLGAVTTDPTTGPVTAPVPALLPRIAAAGGVAVLVALVAGAAVSARSGPLRADGGLELASSLTRELTETGRSVLVLGGPGESVRQVAGRLPRHGDDALVPVAGSTERLAAWRRGLLAGSREAVTAAAAAGVLLVVLPPGQGAERLRQAAPDLVAGAPPTDDGREVVRLLPTGGPVTLIAPEQARRAVSGQPPSGDLRGGTSVAPVDAELPTVRVRVSDGPAGRLLVLAANVEPGWRATVDGRREPIVPAWGHLVSVAVPTRQSEVVVEYPGTWHGVLLLGQLAAVLFAALTAVPARGGTARPGRPSAGGS